MSSPSQSQFWDERYAASELVWSSTPNQWVQELAENLAPGTVIDLGAGEGRNCFWLVEKGWKAIAVDFSEVAINRAIEIAQRNLGDKANNFQGVVSDLLTYKPAEKADLVIVAYIHLPADQRTQILRSAFEMLKPAGRLLVVAHDTKNLTEGFGGPQDPAILYSTQDVLNDLADFEFQTVRAEVVTREVRVDSEKHEALDAILLLQSVA